MIQVRVTANGEQRLRRRELLQEGR